MPEKNSLLWDPELEDLTDEASEDLEVEEKLESASKLEAEGWNWMKPGQQPPEGAELFTSPRGARYWKPGKGRVPEVVEKPGERVAEEPIERPADKPRKVPDTVERRQAEFMGRAYSDSSETLSRSKHHAKRVAEVVPVDHLYKVGSIIYSRDEYGPVGPYQEFKNTAAKFDIDLNSIVIYGVANWKTVVHEIGHAIHLGKYGRQFGWKLDYRLEQLFIDCKNSNSGFPSEYSKVDFMEFFAESYAVYLTNRVELKKRNPEMVLLLDDVMKRFEGVADKEEELRESWERLYGGVKKTEVGDDSILDPEGVGEFDETLEDLEVEQETKQ